MHITIALVNSSTVWMFGKLGICAPVGECISLHQLLIAGSAATAASDA